MLALSPPVADVTRVHMWSRAGRALGYTVSAYVVRGVLIDTGFPRAERELAAVLDELPVRGAMITHGHEDHAGNAALLARRGVPIAAGAATLARLRLRSALPFHRRLVWGTPPPLPDDTPSFSDDRLSLIAAPGHTADHHVVWDAAEGHLFGGDLFLGVKVRVAHTGEDPRLLVRTLRAVAALEPAMLFDAHRGPVARPAPLLRAKADWLEEMVASVDALVAAGAGDVEIRRRLLGAERWVAWGTFGGYSATNLVRAMRSSAIGATGDATGDEAHDPHAGGRP
jgi:glyoxylase-like metal-dependent hydrolase (beta-lactamase superfamily II)